MGESLPMMPWFPRDFIAATRAMRLAERGAYRDLLDFQWDIGRLPKEPDRLARLLGVSLEEFNEVWPAMSDKFVERDGWLYNERVDSDRKTALEQRERKRRGAITTNAKRYAERPQPLSDSASPSGSLSDTDSARSPSPTPSPSKEKITTAAARPAPDKDLPAEFVEFMRTYPKRNGTQPWNRALKAARARVKEGVAWKAIIDGAARYAAWCRATGKEHTETVMQASTFCGPERHFLEAWKPNGGGVHGHQGSAVDRVRAATGIKLGG